MSSSYGPVGESASDILLEKTFMASGYLTGVGFGVQLVLWAACVQNLWRRAPRPRLLTLLIPYLTLLCAANLVWAATSAYGLQLTYIDNRNYPGGPFAFLQVEFAAPSNVVSLAAYIVGNVLADALLLWRCRVIWTASLARGANWVLALPTLMLLASIATGILFAIETASPAGFFSAAATSFALPFFALSLSLNVLLTLLIALRISAHQRAARAALGPAAGRAYAGVRALFVESAALYALVSVLLLGTYAARHPANQLFLGVAPSVQAVANYLIVFRVAAGRAWDSRVRATGASSTVVFAERPAADAGAGAGTGTGAGTAVGIPLQRLDAAEKEPSLASAWSAEKRADAV